MPENVVSIADSSGNALQLASSASTGAAMVVGTGFVLQARTLNSVSGNSTGATVDAGSARSNWTVAAFGTGTLTGTITIELSLDGGNWVSSAATVSLTAAGSVAAFSTGKAARYARANLTSAAGTGTVTAYMMAAG